MQEAKILDQVRAGLRNLGIAASSPFDDAGNVHCIGIGNGKYVSAKIVGPDSEEPADALTKRAEDYVRAISSEMAGQ